MNVTGYESASAQFAIHNVCNLDAVVRNSYFSLMSRAKASNNVIVSALCDSEARIHSRLWQRWSDALGRDMVEVF